MSQPRVYDITMPDHMLSLAELHEMAITFAEELFSRKGQVPFLWIIDLGHEILWMETPWEDDTEKEGSIKIITMIMREAKARAYVNMVEAWAATETYNPHDPKKEFVPPSERPKDQRDDIMMVASFEKKSDVQLITRYLVTVRKHGLNFLGPRDDINEKQGRFTGRMFNLLNKTSVCLGCGLAMGHKGGCMAPMVARIFTAGKVG